MKMAIISEHLGLSWAGESGTGGRRHLARLHTPLQLLASNEQPLLTVLGASEV